MDHNLLISTSDMVHPLNGSIPVQGDMESNLTRAGLRQTDLNQQLEMNNKRRHRLKTQSILLNGKVNASMNSFHDEQSIHSGNNHYQGTNRSADNLLYQQQQQQQQHQYQQYNHYQYQPQPPPLQQQYSNYNPNQQHTSHHQYNHLHTQSRFNDNISNNINNNQHMDSYIYLDEHHELPLQRRFSSHGGVIGTPMSTPPDDHNNNANKRVSLTQSVIGMVPLTPNDPTNSKSLDYMNTLDGDDDNDDWVDISPINEKLKLDNRNLKKKLKDMEIKYETSQVINPIELENEKLSSENSDLLKSISKLKLDSLSTNDKFNELLNFSNELIKRLPNYIPDREICLDIINGIQLPIDLKSQFEKSLCSYDSKNSKLKSNKHIEGTLTDEDLMKLLRSDIKILSSTVNRLSLEKKQIEKIYSKRLNEERRTIRMAAKHKIVHNEFRKSSSYKPNLIKGFKLINPVLIVDENNLKSNNSTPFMSSSPNRQSTTSASSIDEWSDAKMDSNVFTNNDINEVDDGDINNTTITEIKIKPNITNTNNEIFVSDSPKSLVFETFTN